MQHLSIRWTRGRRRFAASTRAALTALVLPAFAGAARAEIAHPEVARWNTVTIAPGSSLPRVAPPVYKSKDAQLQRELNEVLALQASRTSAQIATANFWNSGATVRWNEIGRSLVASHKTPPPLASRFYALLSVAQYDALVAAYFNKYKYGRGAPSLYDRRVMPLFVASPDPAYPSEHAVVAGASAAVIEYIFPDAAAAIEARVREDEDSRVLAGVNFRSDITAGDALGRLVASSTVARGRADGAEQIAAIHLTDAQIPKGAGLWNGTDPLLPQWGRVRPWLLTNVAALRPPAPPAVGSPKFQKALAEVRRISDTRTPEQLRIAQFWADGAGTYTPPGHWNQIACDLILRAGMPEPHAARVLALMNMAMMDAGIVASDTKYTYWEARPWQFDPNITTPIGKPNFPSYVSGHAIFSGAASTVLGYFFSGKQAQLQALAEEAAISRLYGGIHYRFDNATGINTGTGISNDIALVLGRNIASYAYQRMALDGGP